MSRPIRTLPEPPADPGPWLELLTIRRLAWRAYTLPIPSLHPKFVGLRIVHLTDVHIARRWMPAWDKLLLRLVAAPPDLIVFTGDFVDRKDDHRPALSNLRRFVHGLKARLGVYAILGNHDSDLLPLSAPDLPVRVLMNETVTLRDDDAALELTGWYGVNRGDCRPAFAPRSPGTLRLVLSHYPSLIDHAPDADVVFAGHTHGGQVCLPGGRPILTHDPMPKAYARHVHQFGDTYLIVNRGLGFSSYPVRCFCPAEAIEIKLTSGNPAKK
jgi:uncharacterized protein